MSKLFAAAAIVLSLLLAPLAHSADPPVAIKVAGADGKTAFTVDVGSDKVEVGAGAERYVGTTRGDKRDYRRSSDNAAFVEVKASEKGFKLRTPDGKLIWKVKFDADKIKVSDNEENANAYELKLRDDKTKVVDGADKPLGEVKFNAESHKAKVKDAAGAERYSADAPQPSAAYGVLLLTAIPEPQRAILLGEIIARYR